MISAAILAGGSGSRLNGLVKPRIVIEGETIISRIVSVLNDVFNEIIIVTGKLSCFEEYSSVKIIQDEIVNAGPLGGIHAALKASSGTAVFVIAGDMPFPDRELIIRMTRDFEAKICDALVPRVEQFTEPLHSIYNISLVRAIEDFLASKKEIAVAGFLRTIDVRYLQLEKSPGIEKAFTNINSPEDINQLNLPA